MSDPRQAAALERVEAVKQRVRELIPEAVPGLVRPFYEAGLIEGWRNMLDCYPAMGRLPKNNERKG